MPRKRTLPEPPPSALPVAALHRPTSFAPDGFTTTDDLPPGEPIVGQVRAREALDLALALRAPGCHAFVLGPAGTGKRSLVASVLAPRAQAGALPDDWCYVHNFEAPNRPRALRLAPGDGARLKAEMRQYVEELRASIPALLESDEYRSRAEQIDAEHSNRQEALFTALGQEAARQGIALLHTPGGFSFAPTRDGEVMSPEHYQALPEQERDTLRAAMDALHGRLQQAIREAQSLQKAKRDAIKALTRAMTLSVVGALTDDVKTRFAAPAVQAYLAAVQADVLETLDQFRRPVDGEPAPFAGMLDDGMAFRRYEVNVLVGREPGRTGAPVVFEDYPTFPNLIGRIDNMARLGVLVTDFALIQPGALHRANGGYLVIDAQKLLQHPYAWDGLKRALASRSVRPETMGQSLGLATTVSLDAEPIPLDVQVVLLGERELYHLLLELDPEFDELFRIAADFDDDLPRDATHEMRYAQLAAGVARGDGLPPFERAAVARLVEAAARDAEDAQRLSAGIAPLRDRMREAAQAAVAAGAARVTRDHVRAALDAAERRAGRVRQRVLDAVLRGEVLIDTDGAAVGQVNGLSVSQVGQSRFGHPTRITATTRLGDGEVIDIQREVHLGGPIHSKGVMTLAAYLGSRYTSDRPQSLSATLSFEQTYGEVEGDSASLAELVALLSALAGVPILQSFAVTGSVNQHGAVQPIGGVNEKIEGFFDLCAARGLTGRQGVVIPAANVRHLMLREDVVAAAAAGRFHVHAVTHADEAAALLTGLPAGHPAADGTVPRGSLNFLVAARLLELSVMRQAFANLSVRIQRVRARKPATAAPKRKRAP